MKSFSLLRRQSGTIPRVYSRAAASVLAILAACVCSLTGARAMAWGMLKEMDGPAKYGHLVFPVYKNHQINYCISLSESDISPRAGFTYKTINTEIKIALGEWLHAVSDITGPVTLRRVRCQSHFVNLIVYFGAPTLSDSAPSFSAADPFMRSHNYEYVVINSVGRYPLNGISMPAIDFAKLIPPQLSLKSALEKLISQKMSDRQIVSWAGLPNRDDIMEVYNNSFTFMLHEFGHAFGLCDTYQGPHNCDPKYSSVPHTSEQPPSVMHCDRPVYLYPDDIAGIRALFRRFAPVN